MTRKEPSIRRVTAGAQLPASFRQRPPGSGPHSGSKLSGPAAGRTTRGRLADAGPTQGSGCRRALRLEIVGVGPRPGHSTPHSRRQGEVRWQASRDEVLGSDIGLAPQTRRRGVSPGAFLSMTRLPIDVGQEAGAWVSVRTSPGPTEVVTDKRGSESAAGRSADEETGSDFHGHERRWAEIHRVRDRAEAAGSWESEWQDSKAETATSGCACREAERRRRQSTGPARPGAANPGGAEERAFPLTRLQAARGRGRGQQWASISLPLQRAGAPPWQNDGENGRQGPARLGAANASPPPSAGARRLLQRSKRMARPEDAHPQGGAATADSAGPGAA